MTTPAGTSVWRRYNTDGVPASGPHPPAKVEIIAWANSLESEVATATTAASNALTAAAAVAPVNNGLVLAAMPKTAAVTITIATPGVVTWTAHGQPALTPIYFTTTGALPTGITAGTTYYTVQGASLTANNFRLATTIANAIAGVAINTSGSQSGTHTAFANYEIPYPYIGHRRQNTVDIAAGVAAVSGSTGNIWNSIALPAGRWKCGVQTGLVQASGSPVFAHMHADFGIDNSVIQTSPAFGRTMAFHLTSNNPNGWIMPHAEQVFYLPAGGNLNAVATTDFTGGTAKYYGSLWAELF